MEEYDIGERRILKRVDFSQPVKFFLKDSDFFGGCLASDISENGIRVNLNEFVALGAEITLHIQLESERVMERVGQVIWIRKLPFSDRYQAGLKFFKSDSTFETNKEIQDFIQSFRP